MRQRGFKGTKYDAEMMIAQGFTGADTSNKGAGAGSSHPELSFLGQAACRDTPPCTGELGLVDTAPRAAILSSDWSAGGSTPRQQSLLDAGPQPGRLKPDTETCDDEVNIYIKRR